MTIRGEFDPSGVERVAPSLGAVGAKVLGRPKASICPSSIPNLLGAWGPASAPLGLQKPKCRTRMSSRAHRSHPGVLGTQSCSPGLPLPAIMGPAGQSHLRPVLLWEEGSGHLTRVRIPRAALQKPTILAGNRRRAGRGFLPAQLPSAPQPSLRLITALQLPRPGPPPTTSPG